MFGFTLSSTKIAKILLLMFGFSLIIVGTESCFVFKRNKDPQAEYDKKEAKTKKKDLREYKKVVKKYQKTVAGAENEKGKDRKVYKRMKKNARVSKRVNNNKPRQPWIVRIFKKNRVKEPFYVRWGRRVNEVWDNIFN